MICRRAESRHRNIASEKPWKPEHRIEIKKAL